MKIKHYITTFLTLLVFLSSNHYANTSLRGSIGYLMFNQEYQPNILLSAGLEKNSSKGIYVEGNLSFTSTYKQLEGPEKSMTMLPIQGFIGYKANKKETIYYSGLGYETDLVNRNSIINGLIAKAGLQIKTKNKKTIYLELRQSLTANNQVHSLSLNVGLKKSLLKSKKGTSINEKIKYKGPQLKKRTIIKNGNESKENYEY